MIVVIDLSDGGSCSLHTRIVNANTLDRNLFNASACLQRLSERVSHIQSDTPQWRAKETRDAPHAFQHSHQYGLIPRW
jgi:hypothetical protein